MNNTTTTRTTRTKRNLTIVAIFMAATLVVGIGTFTTTTQSAYAYQKKGGGEDNGKGNDNGNTVTIEECKNRGSASGFDTALDQECENLICTHPGENATCVQEGAVAVTPTTPPVKLTCEECFRKFLSADQLTRLLKAAFVNSPERLCALLPTGTEAGFRSFLLRPLTQNGLGLSESAAAQLIQCLHDAGVQFGTGRESVTTLR
jgi:hypothetical protein